MRSESTQFTVSTSKTSLQRIGKLCSATTVCLGMLALAGCGPKRMKVDFIGFERAYAETSTREVLLNLARLKNHETTYFFKLGQISSSYRMQASITGNGNYTIPPVNIGGNATGGGTPGLTLENDPSFTFIPVNDDTSAQLLLKPIPSTTLYNLYQQGWRVDQLFRLMVDRIEVTFPQTAPNPKLKKDPNATPKLITTACPVVTIRNSPPAGKIIDAAYLSDASSYAAFLRVSAMVYALQRSGYLKMRGKSDFVPIDASSFITQADPSAKKTEDLPDPWAMKTPDASSKSSQPAADSSAPKAADLAAAAAKGESWRYDKETKTWKLMQQIQDAEFYLTAKPEDIMSNVAFLANPNDPNWAPLLGSETPLTALAVLHKGFSIDDIPALARVAPVDQQDNNGADSNCAQDGDPTPTAHLVMRSILGIMAEAAQEEEAYNQLEHVGNPLPGVSAGIPGGKTFSESVPQIEKLPLLRLNWKSGDWAGTDIAEINYHGQTYRIADQDPSVAKTLSSENAYWNRDMFRLLNQLSAQVTVDISKFPLPGILQLHTN